MIHQATRLRIVAMLHQNREVSFQALRDALQLTDGNLGSHTQRLTDAGYVEQRIALAGVRFEPRFRLTEAGRDALSAYIRELQRLLDVGPSGADESTSERH